MRNVRVKRKQPDRDMIKNWELGLQDEKIRYVGALLHAFKKAKSISRTTANILSLAKQTNHLTSKELNGILQRKPAEVERATQALIKEQITWQQYKEMLLGAGKSWLKNNLSSYSEKP